MLYVAIWYVSIRPVVMRVKEELIIQQDTQYLMINFIHNIQ